MPTQAVHRTILTKRAVRFGRCAASMLSAFSLAPRLKAHAAERDTPRAERVFQLAECDLVAMDADSVTAAATVGATAVAAAAVCMSA